MIIPALLAVFLISSLTVAQTANDTRIFGEGFPSTCTSWCSNWETGYNICAPVVGTGTKDCLCTTQMILDWVSCYSCIASLADTSATAYRKAGAQTTYVEINCVEGGALVPVHPVTSGTSPTTRTLAPGSTASPTSQAARASADTESNRTSTASASIDTSLRSGGPDSSSGGGTGSGAALNMKIGAAGVAIILVAVGVEVLL